MIGDTAYRDYRKAPFPGDGAHHVMEMCRPRIVNEWATMMSAEDDMQQAVDEGMGHGRCSVPV